MTEHKRLPSFLAASEPGIRRLADVTPSRTLLLVIGLFVAAVAMYWPTTSSLLAIWSDTDWRSYTHGHLVAAASAYLVLRDRATLARIVPAPVPAFLPVVAGLSLLWLIALRAGLQLVHQVLAPIILWAGVLSVAGPAVARRMAFPLGFLYFAIPIWEYLNPVLQALTVRANHALVKVFGIPAWIEGNFVHIPAGVFEIADGCSGLHYFIVALAVAAFHGQVSRDTLGVRVVLLGLAAALALIGNWLRVFVVIVVGHLTRMQHYLVQVEHYWFGWALFALTMMVFFAVAVRFPQNAEPRSATAALPEHTTAGRLRVAAIATLLALAAGPAIALLRAGGLDSPMEISLARVAGFEGPGAPHMMWQPIFKGSHGEVHASYDSPSGSVEVYVAMYLEQRQGRELVGFNNSMLGSGRWRLLGEREVSIDAADSWGRLMEWEVAAENGARNLIWWQYQIGNKKLTEGLKAQLWYGLASIWSSPRSSVTAIAASCLPDCDAARGVLQRFAEASALEFWVASDTDSGIRTSRRSSDP